MMTYKTIGEKRVRDLKKGDDIFVYGKHVAVWKIDSQDDDETYIIDHLTDERIFLPTSLVVDIIEVSVGLS